jgi:mannonate dehydratase
MSSLSRRGYLQGTFAALGSTAFTPAPGATLTGNGKIKLAEIFGSPEDHHFELAHQAGVNHVILGANLGRLPRNRYLEHLQQVQEAFAAKGVAIVGVESHPVPSEKIKLGLDGRDEEMENYVAAIEALGKAGIRMICYNFMAGLGWYRTRVDLPERGGALVSEFDLNAANREGLTRWGEVLEEKIWANLEYFLKGVIPAAERAGVQMALHPDDPPLPKLRGIARIVISAKNYERIMNLVPSPMSGVTFCQANFKLMGEDIVSLARAWTRRKKIFFVHYRDVVGTREHFREAFHDNGSSDMVGVLRAYHEGGFDGPIRPDHAPTMAGESNDSPGYAMVGKVMAFGYMMGIMQASRIPYE